MGSFIRATEHQQETQQCTLVLPYLIIAGYGKCYLQIMELHGPNGIEPVHHLLKIKQERTESLGTATVRHSNSSSCTQRYVSCKNSQLSLLQASPSHTHTDSTGGTSAHLLQQLLPQKPTQPVLLLCSLQQNSLTDTQRIRILNLFTYSNSHTCTHLLSQLIPHATRYQLILQSASMSLQCDAKQYTFPLLW